MYEFNIWFMIDIILLHTSFLLTQPISLLHHQLQPYMSVPPSVMLRYFDQFQSVSNHNQASLIDRSDLSSAEKNSTISNLGNPGETMNRNNKNSHEQSGFCSARSLYKVCITAIILLHFLLLLHSTYIIFILKVIIRSTYDTDIIHNIAAIKPST